jgi:biopolymer transport protein ExbB
MNQLMNFLSCWIIYCAITAFSPGLSAADLTIQADQTRNVAEAAFAASNKRIATEQAALLKQVQVALTASNLARERLNKATAASARARQQLAVRTTEHEQEQRQLTQLFDRTAIAARTGPERGSSVNVPAALAAIEQRVELLAKSVALSQRDETIIARHGRQVTTPVLRLGQARAIAMGPDDATNGLLTRASDGQSWVVSGPRLPPIPVTAGRPTHIAFDASGLMASQPEAVHRTIGEWIAAGRFFIWPIIGVFLLGIGIAIERMIALTQRQVDPRQLIAVATTLSRDGIAAAQALVASATTPLDRVLHAGLSAHHRPREAREASVEQALISETSFLTRGLPAIAVLAGVAPLLGLLGTVTGMIDMFAVIANQGSGNAKSLSGGISEALICTQAGMLVAIPLLLMHAWLARLADRRSQLLEEAACGVLGLTEHGNAPAIT